MNKFPLVHKDLMRWAFGAFGIDNYRIIIYRLLHEPQHIYAEKNDRHLAYDRFIITKIMI